ncbi:MauE/DoxX family redox-associated membrane protein [Nonomuraea longicatena]|uniref:Methylamine utilisation protein MauE domain-containing protein n=1 Tax=Nonomuraea longicatena TaxID=83682 RepID=A0ABP3ZLM4_9ACTN
MQGIAALQPYVIAVFLAWAALLKLLDRRMRSQAGQTALAQLVGQARAIPALRVVAVLELAVAAVLLVPPSLVWEGAAAVVLTAGFLGYLTYSARKAPTSSCGCLGAHSRPVEWRSFARAGLLLALSLTALVGGLAGAPVGAGPVAVSPLLVLLGLAEGLAVVALSPELDRHWLTPLRRAIVRRRDPLAARVSELVPLEVSLRVLYRSPAFCSASSHLSSDVLDTWDEDGLRFISYAARGRTAVFSLPLPGDDPSAVRVALVA